MPVKDTAPHPRDAIRKAIDSMDRAEFARRHGLSLRTIERLHGGKLIDLRDRILAQLDAPEPNR